MLMVTKLDKMVTYFVQLLPIKSYDHTITCSRETTSQIKNIVSPLPQCLWPLKLAGW